MRNRTDQGFDQHYKAQVAVDQGTILIGGHTLSAHPNDKQEAVPTWEAIPTAPIGLPAGAAMDNGYFSLANIETFLARGVEPFRLFW